MDSKKTQENNLKASIKKEGKFDGVSGEEKSEKDLKSKKSDKKTESSIGKSSSTVSKN